MGAQMNWVRVHIIAKVTGYRQAHLECVRTLLLDDAADKSVLNTYMAELSVNVF